MFLNGGNVVRLVPCFLEAVVVEEYKLFRWLILPLIQAWPTDQLVSNTLQLQSYLISSWQVPYTGKTALCFSAKRVLLINVVRWRIINHLASLRRMVCSVRRWS